MGSLQAYLTIPVRFSKHEIYYASRLRLSSLQGRIIIELSRRPCYLNMLARKLSRPNNVILDSLRSLMRKNIVESIVYVSPKIKDRAGVRRYYIIRSLHDNNEGRHRAGHGEKTMRIFAQDDERIQEMRTYYKAMNMLQSPNPIKQAAGRRLIQKLNTLHHQGP